MTRDRRGLSPLPKSILKNPLERIFSEAWPFPPERNQEIEPGHLVDPLLFATARDTSVSLAAEVLGEFDGDSVHHHLRKLTPDHAFSVARDVNRKILHEARRAGLLDQPVIVAADTHKEPDWTAKHEECIRARGVRGTQFVLEYLSIETVHAPRLTLAFEPITNDRKIAKAYEPAVHEALQHARIEMILGDRGLFGRPFLTALGTVPYLVAAQQNGPIKRLIRRHVATARRIPRTKCRFVERPFSIGQKGTAFPTTLVLFWRPDKNTGNLVVFPFITSERNLTPERAHELAYLYLKRWGIETGYRIKNDLRIRTCSPHAGLRRFLQYFAILAHNLWSLLNWLAQRTGRIKWVTVRRFQLTLAAIVEPRTVERWREIG